MRYSLLIFFLFGCDTRVDQSASCQQWVSCIEARDQQLGVTTNMVRFLPLTTDADDTVVNGKCWDNHELYDLCDKACVAGLAKMPELYDDLPEECL